jgi:multimeric flavodoxin WrbA
MKVIAINGSPNKEGNTYHALSIVGKAVQEAGIEFEILHIGHEAIHGCTGCRKCIQNKNEKCSMENDGLNKRIPIIKEADGILLGSPVYYSGIAGTMKCFLDRLFYVSGANGNFFRHKVGAAITAVRRSGGTATLNGLYEYITYGELIVATSNYWNIIHGRNPGEVLNDAEGVQTMRMLGKNMAWLLKMKEAASDMIEEPQAEEKVAMNFIR